SRPTMGWNATPARTREAAYLPGAWLAAVEAAASPTPLQSKHVALHPNKAEPRRARLTSSHGTKWTDDLTSFVLSIAEDHRSQQRAPCTKSRGFPDANERDNRKQLHEATPASWRRVLPWSGRNRWQITSIRRLRWTRLTIAGHPPHAKTVNAIDLIYLAAALVTAPKWARKTRGGWRERFGRIEPVADRQRDPRDGSHHSAFHDSPGAPHPSRPPRLVIHAVSVGEVNALRWLVPLLAEDTHLIITATTDTGLAR